jgi:hypothetical protein
MNKALMGKRIMHSARALFLTFLALEKSKRNSTIYEDYATAEKFYDFALCAFALKKILSLFFSS